jgi:CHAD domain-containing protein
MPRFEKWLIDVSPDDPVDRVARVALTVRLDAARHFLEIAVGKGTKSKGTHRVRIWSRRAAAALRLFSAALPKSQRRGMKKVLRKIRRRAGAARDCDVHLARLKEAGEARPPKAILKALREERKSARGKLKALRDKLHREDRLAARSAELIDSVRWPKRHSSRDAPAFGPWCRQQLAPLGEKFFGLAAENLNDDQHLHALRIAGKRMRYALELALPAISADRHRALYEELTALQKQLGQICDHVAAAKQLQEWMDEAKKASHRHELERLLRQEETALAQCREQFLAWWTVDCRQTLESLWQAATHAENGPAG